ncbi:hypothetical protein [Kosakonia oryziphila]|uniref:Uncharacterized protein n=1 Tax=Kosakonia oryziphila TaxID=1005667 RepID=A0A1C4GPR9_9ENTR|nr:hypothetical protein [Kosakonia oryziphila]SCC70208.1 hypothetical protein GA0061070_11271 [Kosakonia oryziphila]
MTEYEKKLIDHGFSTKDIGKLKSIIEKDESQQDTIQSLVLDLSKRFFGGVLGLFILMLIGLYGIFNTDESDAISYIIVLGFAFLVIYFVTPLKLSWKAYKFIRQSKV